MTTRWFGEPVERREDERLLRGAGRFLDDAGHDALAVAFVRSPYAHARIRGIDVAGALDVEGLVAIYTWDDLPGRLADPLPLLIPHPDLTHPRTQYALARDPDPSDDEIAEALGGNLCRCTGYVNIVRSVRRAAELAGEGP